jgi:hypothetical protein
MMAAGILGLAFEEAIGQRVRDVDLMRRTVTVGQTVEELPGHNRIVPEGKRQARLRTIVASAVVVDAIAEHLAIKRAAEVGGPDALIFLVPAVVSFDDTSVSGSSARRQAELVSLV